MLAAGLVLAGLGLHRLALARLEASLLAALGPRATVGAVDLGWTGLTVHHLRVAGAPGWPAGEELQARKVRVQAALSGAWGGLWGGVWPVARIEVEDAQVVLLRTRDGRLSVLPAVLGPAATSGAASSPATSAATGPTQARVRVEQVRLRRVQVDLYDASLPQRRPHRVRLADLQAQIGPLTLPALDQPVQIDLTAVLKGPRHDGQLSLQGEWTPATRDANLQARLQGVDLLALQPYLLRVAEGGVRRGRLDLQLQATVRGQVLRAPGQVTLTGLELADGPGLLGQLSGLSRRAAVAALSRRDQIQLRFTLEGRLDDPRFSVNDSLAKRFATGLAEALGVSIEGVVEGVGDVFKGLFGR